MTSAVLIAMATKLLKEDSVWVIWGQNGSSLVEYQIYIVLSLSALILIAGV